jgi:hypothetical protein
MAATVALVTPSPAGLGAAIAKSVSPSFRIVINYFSRPEKAAEVVKECEALYPLTAKTESTAPSPRFI